VLSDSTGFWHVEPLADKPGYVRVWFCAAVVLTPVVPNFVVRLVSRLGLQKVSASQPVAQSIQPVLPLAHPRLRLLPAPTPHPVSSAV
jgi:hypothetical protein